jgi:tetratricopeptide (TPR) repeat protein
MRSIVSVVIAGFAVTLAVTGCGARPRTTEPTSGPAPFGVHRYVAGVSAYQSGQTDRAIDEFLAAIRLNPELRMAHSMLGDIYRNRGDYRDAMIHYQRLAELDPYVSSNHYNLGLTQQMLRLLEEAMESYHRSLALEPDDLNANMNLGTVYLALGRLDQAVNFLEKATRLNPRSAAAWMNLGVALDSRGSLVLAEATYRKALELDGAGVATMINLGSNLVAQGKASEAINVLEETLKRSDAPNIRKRYGDALVLAKRYHEAAQQYDNALAANPAYWPALNGKAEMRARQYDDGLQLDVSQRTEAIELFKRSLKINANQPQVEEAIKRLESNRIFGRD